MLNVVDEFTRECLAIRASRKLKAVAAINVLSKLFILRDIPGQFRSDNGPEFIARCSVPLCGGSVSWGVRRVVQMCSRKPWLE
jgi:hypothetical protein